MKEWLTAREIAAEMLPYMPDTERGVQLLSARENWDAHPYARKRQGRGGGMEYRYLIMPTSAQIAYVQKHKRIGANDGALPGAGFPMDASLPVKARLERDARLAILAAFDDFERGCQARGRQQALALDLFARKYNNRSLQIEPWVREAVATISPRSLMRWRATRKKGDVNAFALDRGSARRGTGVLDNANAGAVKAHILGLIASQPHLSGKQVRTLCRAEFGDEVADGSGQLIEMPPLRTFQHFLKGLKETHKVELLKLTNPDRFRSTMLPSGTGMYSHITDPNALWQIDASPVDALCVDGRHSVYVCIDIATRRFITYLSKTPRAAAVGMMIRKAILAWGVPKVIKTDNGSDFVANETQRLFTSLGIDPDPSDAYSPAQKGHVERSIGTWQRSFVSLLPGYVGHSVADRKAIEDRKSFAERLGQDTAETFSVSLTAADMQWRSDEWCLTVYGQDGHSGLDGLSPANKATMSRTSIRMVDERALDVLLMPAAGGNGQRKTTKFGIRIDGNFYREAWMMPGMDVFVRMDPTDKGRALVFSGDQGTYLGEAVCPELAGIHPETFEKARKERNAELVRERIDPIKREIKKITKGPLLIDKVLEVARRDMPNVVALPRREERHETPQIAAAIEALSPRSNEPQPLTEIAARLHEAIVREHEIKTASNVVQFNPDAGLPESARRYKWAVGIEEKIAAGEAIDPEDAVKLGRYQTSTEYATIATIHKDFSLEDALNSAPR